jgi:hypothetical protein
VNGSVGSPEGTYEYKVAVEFVKFTLNDKQQLIAVYHLIAGGEKQAQDVDGFAPASTWSTQVKRPDNRRVSVE